MPDFSLAEDFRVAEEEQRFIWDIESLAFVMGQDLQSAFKAVIREGESESFRGFLAVRLPSVRGRGARNTTFSTAHRVRAWRRLSKQRRPALRKKRGAAYFRSDQKRNAARCLFQPKPRAIG